IHKIPYCPQIYKNFSDIVIPEKNWADSTTLQELKQIPSPDTINEVFSQIIREKWPDFYPLFTDGSKSEFRGTTVTGASVYDPTEETSELIKLNG
ncbi:hypothetical protein, partial [Escherichia coli]|uniref:hypothetical protein n=1 Tax=Escherichia coli TaxID=562 RepID=UPI001FF1F822